MTTKTRVLYTIREEIGAGSSPKQLGGRLRSRPDALRIVKALKRSGRDVFAAPIKVNATEFNENGRRVIA